MSGLDLSIFQQQLLFWKSLESTCLIYFNTHFTQNSCTTDCNIAIVCGDITMEWEKWKNRQRNVFCLIAQGTGFTSPCLKSSVVKGERETSTEE